MTEPIPRAAMLEQTAALGPFFAVDTHDPDSTPEPAWPPMSDLINDPAALRERVTWARAYLAAADGRPPEAVELRVAASVTHLGLVARLISPVLAVAAVHRVVLPLNLRQARWQPGPGSTFPLSLPAAPLTPTIPDTHELAEHLATQLLDDAIRPLHEAMRPLSVSSRVLSGNAASAIHGAAIALAAASPEHTRPASELARHLLETSWLRDASTWEPSGRFRRRSCCLIYRAAPDAASALCGDCILATR